MVPRKARREITSQATVLQTDTGVRGEYPQVRERTLVKELGKFTPYVRKKECRRKPAAVKRPNRLFTKNTVLCKLERGRIRNDACPVLEG
jgi:hypothetical protein